METNRSRASRLANVLKMYSDDEVTVRKIASALNYVPDTLAKDMQAINEYINTLEEQQEER